jgi:hypothetical protein
VDEQDWLLVSLLIHVPTVVAWISLAGAEVVITIIPGLESTQRGRLIRGLRWPTVALILVILGTGVWQTIDNPFLRVDSLAALERLRTTKAYGEALFVKHIFVLATFTLNVLVTFVLSRRLERQEGASVRPLLAAGLVNLGACLGVLLATVGMTAQLH